MIIDVHCHIGNLPDSPFANTSFPENVDLLQKEMQDASISAAIILPWDTNEPGSDPDTDTALSLIKGRNNMFVVGSINPLSYTKEQLQHLDTLLKTKKIIGMKLYLGYRHFYPTNDACKPIYNLCLAHDVPMIFHTGDTLSCHHKAKVKYAHPLALDDVATDFPELRIVIAHTGNPWIMDAAEVAYKNKNVYVDISGLVVSDSLDGPYGDMMVHKLNEFIAYAGAHKMMYGTDWPLARMRDYVLFTERLRLSARDRENVFGINAINVFKLPQSQIAQ